MRTSQESVLKALQQYTLSHYPDVPSKFGELLLRIPELERICQVSKVIAHVTTFACPTLTTNLHVSRSARTC